MPKCLAIRMCAYGDALYALPAFEELARQFGPIHLETGPRGQELFQHHPAFAKITTFDILKYKPKKRMEMALVRWNSLVDGGDWEKVVNFIECIEVACIADEWQEEYFYPRERRHEIFGGKNFYDTHFEKAGIAIPEPFSTGHIYFPEEVLLWMDSWKQRYGDRFIVAIALNGSTSQKYPMYLKELALEIKGAFPDSLFVLLGDKLGQKVEFSLGDKSVLKTAGKWPYMQSLAMTMLADYVIGPETGLLVGAGLFGTPKTMICTSCSPYQATHRQVNDFSVQSSAPCSPCYRSAYTPKWCNYRKHEFGLVPDCNFMVDFKPIMEGVEFAYKVRGLRRLNERNGRNGFGSLPDLRSLLDNATDRDSEIRCGVSS